jgi:nucleoside-diphosphate-sugar epimerase
MPENPLAADLDHVLDHTRGLWEELRGQRIFITGGTGFFGCWLLESLAWANDRLALKSSALVLTRNQQAFAKKAPHLATHPAIQFHTGDIRSFDFPTGSFSHIIHAATQSSSRMGTPTPLEEFDTIVSGTRRVLDFALQGGCRKFLFTSSGAVYGRQPPGLTHIPEGYLGAPDPVDPGSVYGEGKRAAETMCALYSKQNGIETKIARCFAFVGPYLPLDAHFAIGNFIRDGLKGGPIVVLGNGTPRRSYLYASDLAIWLWTILFKGQSCQPYNVGSDESISIAEVAHRAAAQFPGKMKIEILGKPRKEKEEICYVPDISKAKKELGLRPLITFRIAIGKTIQFIKSNDS